MSVEIEKRASAAYVAASLLCCAARCLPDCAFCRLPSAFCRDRSVAEEEDCCGRPTLPSPGRCPGCRDPCELESGVGNATGSAGPPSPGALRAAYSSGSTASSPSRLRRSATLSLTYSEPYRWAPCGAPPAPPRCGMAPEPAGW